MRGKPANLDDSRRDPQLREEIGEDPHRFLTLSDNDLAKARIRGIDRYDVLHQWVKTAQELDAGDQVLEELRIRATVLNRRGERPDLHETDLDDLADDSPWRRRDVAIDEDQDDQEDVEHVHEGCGATVEDRGDRSWYCPDCDQLTNRVDTAPVSGDENQQPEVTS